MIACRLRDRITAGVACLLVATAMIPAQADLTLQISSGKTRYLLDEPLYVTVAIENRGPGDAAISREMDPAVGLLTFEIVPPGEPARPYGLCAHADLDPAGLAETVVNLAPGEQYSAVANLSWENKDKQFGAVLSAAGNYILRATYEIPKGWPVSPLKVRSNDLSLEVQGPEGEDRAAYEILRQGGATARLGPWNSNSKQAPCYETLLREYPGSGYAIHAQCFLAHVYHCDGIMGGLRGTPDGARALENAAALSRSVAADAGQTPLGIMALIQAATDLAMVGRAAEAQALLEQAFGSPAATDEDRLRVVRLMEHVENGVLHRESGLAQGEVATAKARLPLRRVAQALGLKVSWNPASKTMRVSGRKVRSTVRLGEQSMLVNGQKRTGIQTWLVNGEPRVSLSVVATLMAEQRGGGVANALSSLVARAPKPRKPQAPASG